MSEQWRAHKAIYVRQRLRSIGYTRLSSDGVVWLVADGRPPIVWGFANKQVIPARLVRSILLEQADLSDVEARRLLAGGGACEESSAPGTQVGGHYVARVRPDFLDTLIPVRGRVPPRWRSRDGRRLYEYDPMHGHIEMYSKTGNHLGVLDVDTGERIGRGKRGRVIGV